MSCAEQDRPALERWVRGLSFGQEDRTQEQGQSPQAVRHESEGGQDARLCCEGERGQDSRFASGQGQEEAQQGRDARQGYQTQGRQGPFDRAAADGSADHEHRAAWRLVQSGPRGSPRDQSDGAEATGTRSDLVAGRSRQPARKSLPSCRASKLASRRRRNWQTTRASRSPASLAARSTRSISLPRSSAAFRGSTSCG